MTDGPIQFPVDEDARARLDARRPHRRRRQNPAQGVIQPPVFGEETRARIREDEKRRAMPERLVMLVIIGFVIVTLTPVALLALVGY
ncbi:MAG: hypothetical protein AAGG79_05205 [Pseudomonadota bacterium]